MAAAWWGQHVGGVKMVPFIERGRLPIIVI